MTAALVDRVASLRSGRPQGRGLHVLPLFGPSAEVPRYRPFDMAAAAFVKVTEVSEAGSVPQLSVENTLDECVFLMDGQELVGAKQNRILNTDVIVAAGARLPIPVSCVEQGRWAPSSPTFAPGRSASYLTRSGKVQRVHNSLKKRAGHDADQGAVWAEVRESVAGAGAASPTGALSDAYAHRARDLDAFRAELDLPSEAVGFAVFQGPRLCGLDVFDRHATLAAFFPSLVDSYALDLGLGPASAAPPTGAPDDEGAVLDQTLRAAAGGRWDAFPSPGLGQDHRLDDERLSGSALLWDGAVIHLQLFPRDPAAQRAAAASQAAPAPRLVRRYLRPGPPAAR